MCAPERPRSWGMWLIEQTQQRQPAGCGQSGSNCLPPTVMSLALPSPRKTQNRQRAAKQLPQVSRSRSAVGEEWKKLSRPLTQGMVAAQRQHFQYRGWISGPISSAVTGRGTPGAIPPIQISGVKVGIRDMSLCWGVFCNQARARVADRGWVMAQEATAHIPGTMCYISTHLDSDYRRHSKRRARQ